jgi:Arc/MetJ-type ribon-helix-helix transcriptional regulator
MTVSLTDDLKDLVRQKVGSGAFPSEQAVLEEAVRRLRQDDRAERANDAMPTLKKLIDWEAIESCAREVAGKDVPTIEEVRAATSKIKDSMARVVIEEERAERF